MLTVAKDLGLLLLQHGAVTSAAVFAGGLAGLIGSIATLWVGHRALNKVLPVDAATTRVLTMVVWILAVPVCLISLGLAAGAGLGVRLLVADPRIFEQVGKLGLDASATALEELRSAEKDASDEIAHSLDLASELLEGEKTYPIEELPQVLESISVDAMERASIALDSMPAPDPPGILWIFAREGSRRLLDGLVLSRTRAGQTWLDPVVERLVQIDQKEDGNGEVDGHQIVLALAEVRVQRPLARWTMWAVLLQGLPFVIVLIVVVIAPFFVAVLLRGHYSPSA